MRDQLRKLFVLGLFGASVASVWALGVIKADLDNPFKSDVRVDPAIVRAAQLADPGYDPAAAAEFPQAGVSGAGWGSSGYSYWFAS